MREAPKKKTLREAPKKHGHLNWSETPKNVCTLTCTFGGGGGGGGLCLCAFLCDDCIFNLMCVMTVLLLEI